MVRIFREEQAKQGNSGRRVLVIMVVSLVLALIVWAVVEFYGTQIDDSTAPVVETERESPPAVELDQPESATD